MKQKISLSRDLLVERALKIADTDGLDALTIRRLADEFEVTPMAMYWHFANKDALLGAIGEAVIESIPLPDADADLENFLTAVMTSLVDGMRAHPGVATLVAYQLLRSERGRDLTELTLAHLTDAGLDLDRAVAVATNALQIAIMLVTSEPGLELDVPAEEREAVRAQKREILAGLPADRYPLLIASADAFTSCEDSEDYYELGITTFVSGVVASNRKK